MSGEQKREVLLFILILCISTFQPGRSVSLGKLEDHSGVDKVEESTAPRWIQLDPHQDKWLPDRKVTKEQQQHKSDWPGSKSSPLQIFPIEEEAILRKLGKTSSDFTVKELPWTAGNVSKHQGSQRASDSEKEYQSDFTGGLPALQGDILGVSVDTTHLSDWLAMRPLVHCDHNVMTFSASGGGFTNLLVGRDGGSPVSLFNLPSYCGYSVKTTWNDLEMTVPYDACYIIQENGRIILPVLWWGSPLKLSCPMWRPTPVPSVYCSSYGMAVQIDGQKEDLPTLGMRANGRWGPLVAEECASLVSSQPEKFLFFIPITASCITVEDGLHLWLIIDELEYTLSCPQFPSFPPPTPSEPQFPFFPDPISPTSAPPQAPTQQHVVLLPKDPFLLHPEFPQIYPPGPQPAQPPKTFPGSPPGPQPQRPVRLSVPVKKPYFDREHIKPHYPQQPPVKTPSYNTAQDILPFPPNRPVSQYFSNLYFAPHYSELSPPQSSTAKHATSPTHPFLPPYYLQVPYHFAPERTPAPSPTPPRHPVNFFYPPHADGSYNPYQFYHQTPVHLQPPSPPPLSAIPQKFHEPYLTYCLPYGSMVCTYYPNPYYHPPPSPLYPPETMQQPAVTTASPTTIYTPSPPRATQHYCLRDRMLVFLPFARPDSIQVRDQTNAWLFLSDVSPLCGYILRAADNAGIILHSSLPACHSYPQSPTSTSLTIRFWDMSVAQYRTLDVHCPQQTIIPPPFRPPVSPAPPGTSGDTNPKVFCSSHHMSVELPAGPISEIVLKDMNGNKMNLRDVPEDCGYSASMGKDGKIHLSLPLHLRCYMSSQGTMYIITFVYTTFDGTREAQVSCPGVVPSTGQECNLPSEQRLPCGPGSVSQPLCVSMGCCFSKRRPVCYYPMDECTIDRHFVFSVPASLTEPPLSPALLVAASNYSCKPQKVTSGYALFKIPMNGCGARRMQVGKTVIYMLEVINIVNSISLNYGTITRDSPVRLLVECRFLPGNALTVSYLVKTPTLGPAVQTQGAFGVQLRIARDHQYKSYLPQYHQPLQMLLGKPLYLEVRLLNSPDPSLVLLVHYCVAYPRSGKAVWVLLYNGCPNPLDPASQQVVPSEPQLPSHAQIRRFTISTFQFLPDGEFKDPNEEIYFMCSTEICSPRDGPCVEGCFGQ